MNDWNVSGQHDGAAFCHHRSDETVVGAVAVAVAGVGGCDAASTLASAERFTQGGVSMEPTVKAGQVITTRAVGRKYKPRHGDVVVFHPPGGRWGNSKAPFLKRVIAIGGETIACCDSAGKVTVNGEPLAEPYVDHDAPLDRPPNPYGCGPRRFGAVAVPTGTVFVMGDNRVASNDSRCEGPIPETVFAVMVS